MPHLRVNVKAVARSHGNRASNSPHAQRATRSFGRDDKTRRTFEIQMPTNTFAGKPAACSSLHRRVSLKRAEQYLAMKRNSIDVSAFCGGDNEMPQLRTPPPQQPPAHANNSLSVHTCNETSVAMPSSTSRSSSSSYCSFESHITQTSTATGINYSSNAQAAAAASCTVSKKCELHRQLRLPSDSVSVHSPSVFSSSSTDAEGSGPASPNARQVLSGSPRSGRSPKGKRTNRVLCMKTICIPGAPDIRRRSFQDSEQKTDDI